MVMAIVSDRAASKSKFARKFFVSALYISRGYLPASAPFFAFWYIRLYLLWCAFRVALLSSLRRVRALSLDMALAHTRSRISLWLTSPLSTDYSTLGSKQGNIVLFKVSHCVINYGHQGKCSEDFDSIPGASTLSGKQPAHTD